MFSNYWYNHSCGSLPLPYARTWVITQSVHICHLVQLMFTYLVPEDSQTKRKKHGTIKSFTAGKSMMRAHYSSLFNDGQPTDWRVGTMDDHWILLRYPRLQHLLPCEAALMSWCPMLSHAAKVLSKPGRLAAIPSDLKGDWKIHIDPPCSDPKTIEQQMLLAFCSGRVIY